VSSVHVHSLGWHGAPSATTGCARLPTDGNHEVATAVRGLGNGMSASATRCEPPPAVGRRTTRPRPSTYPLGQPSRCVANVRRGGRDGPRSSAIPWGFVASCRQSSATVPGRRDPVRGRVAKRICKMNQFRRGTAVRHEAPGDAATSQLRRVNEDPSPRVPHALIEHTDEGQHAEYCRVQP
jgi:hypothetical protein